MVRAGTPGWVALVPCGVGPSIGNARLTFMVMKCIGVTTGIDRRTVASLCRRGTATGHPLFSIPLLFFHVG